MEKSCVLWWGTNHKCDAVCSIRLETYWLLLAWETLQQRYYICMYSSALTRKLQIYVQNSSTDTEMHIIASFRYGKYLLKSVVTLCLIPALYSHVISHQTKKDWSQGIQMVSFL